jgi:hypothetical protein
MSGTLQSRLSGARVGESHAEREAQVGKGADTLQTAATVPERPHGRCGGCQRLNREQLSDGPVCKVSRRRHGPESDRQSHQYDAEESRRELTQLQPQRICPGGMQQVTKGV